MKKNLILIMLFIFISFSVFAQNAEDVFDKHFCSKAFLFSKGITQSGAKNLNFGNILVV